MTEFVLAAVAITLVVVFLLLRPLLTSRQSKAWEREQQNLHFARQRLQELEQQQASSSISSEEYEALREEIESSLAADLDMQQEPDELERAEQTPEQSQANGILIALVCTLIPFTGLALYQLTGDPDMIDHQPAAQSQPTAESIDNMVASLEQRLQNEPNDAEGWAMLARSYLTLGRLRDSITANQHLLEIGGEDANIYAQMADAAVQLSQGDLAGEAGVYMRKALALNPDQPQALWLAGLAAAQQGDGALARTHWKRLLPLLDGVPEQQQQLREIIQQSETGNPPLAANDPQPEEPLTPTTAADPRPGVSVRVSLAPNLSGQTQSGETVYVFARALNGPPAPLAVRPLRVSDLPAEVRLTDADGMIPQLKLSAFDQITVSARIAKSGNPVAQPGDLQSEVVETSLGTDEVVSLLISEIIP